MMKSHATSTETEAAKNVRRTVLLLMGVSGCGKTTIGIQVRTAGRQGERLDPA